jgi:Lon protease-like protein
MKVNIFPLPIFLLPGGKVKIRVFELKYIRLVKESYATNGFVLSTFDENDTFNTTKEGVFVEIVDFYPLDDGLLSIEVIAKKFVKLKDVNVAADGLLKADIEHIKHWANETICSPSNEMTQFLNKVFINSKQLSLLYTETKFDDKAWVCARILEILPLTTDNKIKISTLNFEQCENFLHTVIKGN